MWRSPRERRRDGCGARLPARPRFMSPAQPRALGRASAAPIGACALARPAHCSRRRWREIWPREPQPQTQRSSMPHRHSHPQPPLPASPLALAPCARRNLACGAALSPPRSVPMARSLAAVTAAAVAATLAATAPAHAALGTDISDPIDVTTAQCFVKVRECGTRRRLPQRLHRAARVAHRSPATPSPSSARGTRMGRPTPTRPHPWRRCGVAAHPPSQCTCSRARVRIRHRRRTAWSTSSPRTT